jgi:quercetin dioxygenase-like cupin family protein
MTGEAQPRPPMKMIRRFLILSFAISTSAARTSTVIPLASEPHHHLALHNQYVNVYRVEVAPHDSVLLHRHDYDAISVMLGDARVTVHAPGKADLHQDLQSAQIRLQPRGYIHQTAIDGNKWYRNVTVELLMAQRNESNLCAQVIAAQLLHCPPAVHAAAESTDQPQFGSDQTTVTLTHILPRREVRLMPGPSQLLIIALDATRISLAAGRPAKDLRPGDFVWLSKGDAARTLTNSTDRDIRFVTFALTGP